MSNVTAATDFPDSMMERDFWNFGCMRGSDADGNHHFDYAMFLQNLFELQVSRGTGTST